MTENSSTQTPQQFTFGKMKEYDEDSDFTEYLERMELFFLMNKITEDREKVAAFIIFAGQKVYTDLKMVIAPKEVSDLTFQEIKQNLLIKYEAKGNQLRSRCEFYKRVQMADESVEKFAGNLLILAQKCSFGNSQDTILRDRFVGGIRNHIIQDKLIEDGEQTFKEVLEKARNYEIVEKICMDFARKI